MNDQDQEWRDWKQILAERHKYATDLKEFQEWQKAKKQESANKEKKGRELFYDVCAPPLTPRRQRFAF